MKYLIFDSGPLINFSMNGVLPLLKRLKEKFSGKFLITENVKKEVMDYPKTIKRFGLGALQVESLFKEGVIELPDLSAEQEQDLKLKSQEIINIANSMFRTKNKDIRLLDDGEATILALSSMLNQPNVLAVDERTTRMLCENPENLRKLLQKKLHSSVAADKKNYDFFKRFKVIRSTELVYIAHKKNLFDLKDSKALEAMLYAVKYKGCSVSEEEIKQITRL